MSETLTKTDIVDYTDMTGREIVIDGLKEGSLVGAVQRLIDIKRGTETNVLRSDWIRVVNTIADFLLALSFKQGGEAAGVMASVLATTLAVYLEKVWDEEQGVFVPLQSYVIEGMTRVALTLAAAHAPEIAQSLHDTVRSLTPAAEAGADGFATTPTPPPFVEVPIDMASAQITTTPPPLREISNPTPFDLKSILLGVGIGAGVREILHRFRSGRRREVDDDES